ncbi:MAG: patatin-like phospholipase family protein [Intestinibacter sp.]
MSIGVCLPGGGSKGAFQAGVLESLYERGIKKYDSYACTSIGAMNGYYLYTGNVDKMKNMWISSEKIAKKRFKSVDNIIDNSEVINPLYELKDNKTQNNSKFYVNYLQVKDKTGKEVITDISKFDHPNRVDYIKYSCSLPYHQEGRLFSLQEVKEYVEAGKFDGFNLDGGMARNTYIDPLVEDNVDKILIISTRHNFKLPDRVKEKIDNSKVVIISPETQIDNKQMLNFSKEICSKIYEEGYKIGQNFDLSLLGK